MKDRSKDPPIFGALRALTEDILAPHPTYQDCTPAKAPKKASKKPAIKGRLIGPRYPLSVEYDYRAFQAAFWKRKE